MSYSLTPAFNIKGPKGEDGKDGRDGLDSPGAISAADFITALMNVEGPAQAQLLDLISSQLGGYQLSKALQFVELLKGSDINEPRPVTPTGAPWPGKIVWISEIGRPTNMIVGHDIFAPISDDVEQWSPKNEEGIVVWANPRRLTADGAFTALPDSGPAGRDMASWTQLGSTTSPEADLDGLNGTPAMSFPSRSGLSVNFTISNPTCVVTVVSARFGAAPSSSTPQTLYSLGGSDTGKYSIQRTQAGPWAFSVDGITAYNFGQSDGNLHIFTTVTTKTKARVYIDGILALEQDIAFETLPSVSSFRLAFVAAGSSNVSWHAATGSLFGDSFVRVTENPPDAARLKLYLDWAIARRTPEA
jgi:hypothetical protein